LESFTPLEKLTAKFAKDREGRKGKLALIDQLECFENRVADDFQTLWAQFVDRVLRCVMEDVAVSVVEINDVGYWNA
jgi:hypothetical protein